MSKARDPRLRDFFVTRPLGTGHSNPHDVLRTRKALNVTGHAHSPPNPSTRYDPSLIMSLERFQRDWGLADDSVIEPGGPTEQTLELAVQAARAGGRDGMEMLRGPMSILNRAGLHFAPDPDDASGPVLWHDRDGNRVPLDHVRRLLAETDASGESEEARQGVQVAMATREMRPGGRSQRLEDLLGPGRGGGGNPIQLAPLFKSLFDTIIKTVTGKGDEKPEKPENAQPSTPSSNGPAKRTVPLDDPPKGPPPFPAEPPPDPDRGKEQIKAEERRPTLTVFPIDEDDGPAFEIFPDMSDELEKWLYLESRGKPDGQQKDLQYIIEYLYDELGRRGIERDHVGGGYHAKSGKYLKERFIHKTPGQVLGGHRSDGTIEIKKGEDTEFLDTNIQSTLADNETGIKKERDALEAIIEHKAQLAKEYESRNTGDTIAFPKSKGWNWEEWTAEMRRRIDTYLDLKYGPFPQ